MNITVVVPPPVEPITLAEAYAHLRWDTELEGSPAEVVYPLGDLVQRNITSARIFVEQATRRALVMQKLRMSTGSFADIELLRPPFISLESVEYIIDDGTVTPLDLVDFFTTDDEVPRLRAYSRVFEGARDLSCWREDALRVEDWAGYAPTDNTDPPPTVPSSTDNVPAGLKDSILLHVQLLCDRFDANEKADLERTRDALISSYRVHTF